MQANPRPSEGAAATTDDALHRTLVRDVNRLRESDRMTRRRALANIHSVLVDAPHPPPPEAVCRFFATQLQSPLLQILEEDAVEKCRELALKIVHGVVLRLTELQEDGGALASLTAAFLPLATRRVGVAPFLEPTEEIRLAILQLLFALLSTQPGWAVVEKGNPDLTAILARELLDSFPDAKREACALLGLAAQRGPTALRLHQSTLLPPLLTTLGHQQSKVRQAGLQALGGLLAVGNDAMPQVMSETVLPALEKTAFDRTPLVRKELAGVVGAWLQQGGTEQEMAHDESSVPPYYFQGCEADLLFVLLLGMSDETQEVVEATAGEAKAVGQAWVRRKQRKMAVFGGEEDDEDEDRSSQGEAAAMVRALLPSLLPKVLDDVGHWTLRMRHRSVLLLSEVVRLAGPALVAFLPATIATLVNAARDEEPEVASAVAGTARRLGEGVAMSTLLHQLLPIVRGERGAQLAERVAALLLLQAVLEGAAAAATVQPGSLSVADMEALTHALMDPGLLEVVEANDVAALAVPLAEALLAVVDAAPSQCHEQPFEHRLLRVALQLRAVASQLAEEDYSPAPACTAALQALAGGEEAENISLLWFRHFEALLQEVAVDAVQWVKDSPGRMAFDALLRECPEGAARHWDKVMTVLTPQIVEEKEEGREGHAELRLAHVLLLETLIESSLPLALAEHAMAERCLRHVLHTVLLPTIVWRGGRAAATVRKVALVCLYGVLRLEEVGVLLRGQVLGELMPLFLPVLQTNLEDSDATSRHLVALSLGRLFSLLTLSSPSSAPPKQVQQLCPELVKRLNDASDDVRLAACLALQSLFALPDVYFLFTNETLEGAVDALLVHLDEAEGRDAVCGVLASVAGMGTEAKALVEGKARKGAHREMLINRLTFKSS